MKKYLVTAVLIICTGVLLFAAGEQEKGEEKIKISFTSQNHGEATKGEIEAINQFQKENPNIEVEILMGQWEEYYAQLKLSVMSGTPPTIATILSNKLIELKDSLTPLNSSPVGDLIDMGNIDVENYDKSTWSIYGMEGNQYAIPHDTLGFLLWYNTDIFEEAGVDPSYENFPKNMEAFSAVSEKIKEAGYHAFHPASMGLARFLRRTWKVFLYQQGGTLFNEEGTAPAFNNEKGLTAMQFLVDIFNDKGWNTPGGDAYAQFPAGQVGIVWAGTWAYGAFSASDINWKAHPMIAFYDTPYTFGGSNGLTIPKQPKETSKKVYEAAIKLIKSYCEENMYRFTLTSGFSPAYIPQMSHPALPESDMWNRVMAPFSESVKNGLVLYPINHMKGGELQNSMQVNVELAVLGELSPQEALDKMEEEWIAILNQ